MNCTTIIPLNFTEAGYSIPAGTSLELTFHIDGIRSTFQGRTVRFRYLTAYKRFGKPFTKAPGIATLTKWSDNGVCRTPTGAKVDPDGYGSDGCPSWLLVLGLI